MHRREYGLADWETGQLADLETQRFLTPVLILSLHTSHVKSILSSVNIPVYGNWNFRSRVLSLPGTFVPWNFRSRERKWRGTFDPGNFNSRCAKCVFLAATRALLRPIGYSETSFQEQETKQLESKHAGTQCRLMKGITRRHYLYTTC